jgi:hypothetical protein
MIASCIQVWRYQNSDKKIEEIVSTHYGMHRHKDSISGSYTTRTYTVLQYTSSAAGTCPPVTKTIFYCHFLLPTSASKNAKKSQIFIQLYVVQPSEPPSNKDSGKQASWSGMKQWRIQMNEPLQFVLFSGLGYLVFHRSSGYDGSDLPNEEII